MTVSSTTRKAGPFSGNGSTMSFPFSFKIYTKNDIAVTLTDSSGNITTLVLDSDYTVNVNANQDTSPGGTVNYPVGYPTNPALPTGSTLTVTGNLAYNQTTQLPSGGAYNATNVEQALDRLTMLTQQLLEAINRALALPVSSTASSALPTPSANLLLGWNSSATALQNVDGTALGGILAAEYSYSQTFSGTGAQTAFTLSSAPAATSNTDVYIGGVHQTPGTAYTLSGTTVTFTAAPPAGTDNIQVKWNAAVGTSGVQAYATAALGYLNTFKSQYYGSAAADPATDPLGAACTAGDLYFNTAVNQMRVYTGTAWVAVPGTVRITTLADATSITINADNTDLAVQVNTQAAGTLTINAPTGTPTNGQKMIVRLQCTNAQTLSWNAAFAGSNDVALPTTSTGSSKTDYIGLIYNSTAGKWQIIAKVFGF